MRDTSALDINRYHHRHKQIIRFSDLDALGHVNNAKYLTYLEESRVAWFRDATGMPADSVDWDVILARIEIDFIDAAKFGDVLTVHTSCVKIGNKSLNLESAIFGERKGESFPVAWYRATMVYFDYQTQQTRLVPNDVRDKINQYQNTYL